MTEIKSKREQIPADAFRASIQSPLSRMAHVTTRHSSQQSSGMDMYTTKT
jgi:hypothetical protein